MMTAATRAAFLPGNIAILLAAIVLGVAPETEAAPASVDPAPTEPDPLAPYWQAQAALEDTLGLDITLGYTLVFQHATDVVEPTDSLLTGSFDIVGEWTLLEHDTLGIGTLGFVLEGGQILTHNSSEDLSANVGSILGINDDRDAHDLALTSLWWAQQFADDAVTLTLGKLDPTDHYDSNRIANDETTQFLATPLVNNVAVPFPDNGLGVNLRYQPGDTLYLTAGVHDAAADARETGFNTVDEGDRFVAAEVGFELTPPGLGEGTYRFLGWHTRVQDADGSGFALSFDQALGGGLIAFARYGVSDGEVADFERFASAGLGIEAPLGRPDDLVAAGVVWADPSDPGLREETLVELFYRVQVTRTLAVTPDVQVIFDPALNAEDDTVAVLGVRLQATF